MRSPYVVTQTFTLVKNPRTPYAQPHLRLPKWFFAILENWYHHIVFTHICKLASFLHIYLLFYFQKSGNEPDACKKRYSRIRIFTFYLFKAEQYTSGRVQNVGCVYYCCCSYYAAARYNWKLRLAVVNFDWRHLIAKPSTRTSVRCKNLGDICCTSRSIAHFLFILLPWQQGSVGVKFS